MPDADRAAGSRTEAEGLIIGDCRQLPRGKTILRDHPGMPFGIPPEQALSFTAIPTKKRAKSARQRTILNIGFAPWPSAALQMVAKLDRTCVEDLA
jgi:hypothetical protein